MIGSFSGALATLAMLLFFQVCGVTLARVLLPQEGPAPRLLLGSVFGSVLLQWLPALLAFFLGFTLNAHLLAILLASLLTAGAVILARKHNRLAPFSLRQLSGVLGHSSLVAVLALWLFFCFLVLHSFRWADGRIYSSQATYGDMSIHLSFITSLARQGTFPPSYSLLPGTRLSYPFLSDSISSSLYLLGAPLRLAYCLPMLLSGAQVFFGGWLFLRALSGSDKKAGLAFTFFFLNGGLGLMYFLGGEEGNFSRIFTAFYETPTNYSLENIRWVNVIVDMMLPQRATLFGWALLFPTLYLLTRAVFHHKRRYYLIAGLMAGALPMIHTHSFVAMALICGGWLLGFLLRELSWENWGARAGKLLILLGLPVMWGLQELLRRTGKLDSPSLLWTLCAAACLLLLLLGWLLWKRLRQGAGRELLSTWGVLLFSACVLALPQLCFWTFRQAGSDGFIRGHFGWSIGEDNYLWFYLKNIGLGGLLALGGLLTAKSREFSKYAPALVIWFFAEFAVFQPNPYDNNKLLYTAYLLLCCGASEFFFRLLRKIRLTGVRRAAAGAAVALCSFSAVLTVGREWNARYEIYGDGAIALCEFVEEHTAPDSLILTDTRHNNEICSLAGRNILCGSSSYLYFHGLPYGKWEHAVELMYERPEENEALFREYGVQYILVSDFERSTYEVNEEWIAGRFSKIYDDGVRVLYDARQ